MTVENRKRDQKASSKYTMRTEEEKAAEPERKVYKGLRKKLKRARNEREEYKVDLDELNEEYDIIE